MSLQTPQCPSLCSRCSSRRSCLYLPTFSSLWEWHKWKMYCLEEGLGSSEQCIKWKFVFPAVPLSLDHCVMQGKPPHPILTVPTPSALFTHLLLIPAAGPDSRWDADCGWRLRLTITIKTLCLIYTVHCEQERKTVHGESSCSIGKTIPDT